MKFTASTPVGHDDAGGARHLIACLLLRAARDAAWGSAEAGEWLAGTDATSWAQWINLPRWPPTRAELLALKESALDWEAWAWARGLDSIDCEE